MNRLISKQFVFIFFALALNACTQSDKCPEKAVCSDQIQTTETGLKYIHHINYPRNRKPEPNEIMTMHYLLLTDKGDTLIDTYKLNEPVGQPLLQPAYKGAIEEGFRMLNVGDSATFYVLTDSLQDAHLPFPPQNRKEIKEIRYVIKLYNTQSKAAFDIDEAARVEKRAKAQIPIQDKKIVEYLKKQSIFEETKKHPAGFYYKITEEGKGLPAQLGDSIAVTFTTRIIPQERIVDATEKGKATGYIVGKKQVLPVWQIAFAQLAPKGTKITLFSPSHLAFGSKRNKQFPAFSMLQFDIEVVDIIRKNEIK